MTELLDRKIRQMHKALDDLENPDIASVQSKMAITPTGSYSEIDFSEGTTEAGLAKVC